MQPALPTGFHSWTQVLTDWSVWTAFESSGLPKCFVGNHDLAAPFVAEISAYIRLKLVELRPLHLDYLQDCAAEAALAQAAGPSYRALCTAADAAQRRCVSARVAAGHVGDAESRRAIIEQTQACQQPEKELTAFRRHHAAIANTARVSAAQSFWSTHSPSTIPDAFFADVPLDSAAARLCRIQVTWWGGFVARLQDSFALRHPADGIFLDALPTLRAQAKKKTLEAMIAEWREANADRLGWYEPKFHYRMLAIRATKKARQVAAYSDACAPGYRQNYSQRCLLRARLADRLAQLDPWSGGRSALTAHGRN